MVEVLIVVAIAAIVFLFSAPYSLNFYRTQLVEETRNNIVDALERARHNAALQKNDSQFGVYINDTTDQFVVFQGASYATKVDLYDEVYDLLPDIVVTGETEIVFSKLTGNPDQTGTTTITMGNISRGILTEESGTISKID